MDETPLSILDLETTRNALTKEEEIVEIACIKIDSKFNIVSTFHTLVNPACPLTFITKMKTGIQEADVVASPQVHTVLPLLLAFFGNDTVIAHHAQFDYRVLQQTCKRYHLPLKNTFVDSLSLLRTIFPHQKCSLGSLKERFGISKGDHRSFDDVEALREILRLAEEQYCSKFGESIVHDLYKFTINEADTQKILDL